MTMDVGSLLGALTGGKSVGIDIQVQAPASRTALSHLPRWALHKSPFWKTATVSPQPQHYAHSANDDVHGLVIVRLNKATEHLGILIQFIGRIDLQHSDGGRPHYDFVNISKELCPPGILTNPETVVPFVFKNIEKELESYQGRNVNVRYFVRVKMERKYLPPVTQEKDIWVQLLGQEPNQHETIKMEVGIEECLHIEFEYCRRHFHLSDTVLGSITFRLVSIKLKHMELAVLRRETSGEGVAGAAGNNVFTETQTLVKYEIMDGAPVKGEVIPVKLSLDGIPADLTPTYAAHNNRYSVRYYLNLVLVDDDDRRYFKQQEIVLWRKQLG